MEWELIDTKLEWEVIDPKLYGCVHCSNIVTSHEDIMAQNFVGIGGPACLFSDAMNIIVGPKREANMLTGRYVVVDISCSDCKKVLGWRYEEAFADAQKFKEGKFVIVNKNLVKANW